MLRWRRDPQGSHADLRLHHGALAYEKSSWAFETEEIDHECAVVGVPKTIDNASWALIVVKKLRRT